MNLATKGVIFEERGMDGYWSNNGDRLIYSAIGESSTRGVSIWHYDTGAVARNVAPPGLGDYYSWSERDGQDLIVTIAGNYYFLEADRAVLPAGRMGPYPGIGVGERTLVSHDGRRVSAFYRGTVIVRDLADCALIFDTGIRGAKADFSFDGNYIAFHAPRPDGSGSDIDVVDLQKHTVRNVTAGLAGASLFPSWTRDGRLCFRYEGPDYRGFVMAKNVLDAPAKALPPAEHLGGNRMWADLFPLTKALARVDPDMSHRCRSSELRSRHLLADGAARWAAP